MKTAAALVLLLLVLPFAALNGGPLGVGAVLLLGILFTLAGLWSLSFHEDDER
jgi:hypothetical protein